MCGATRAAAQPFSQRTPHRVQRNAGAELNEPSPDFAALIRATVTTVT